MALECGACRPGHWTQTAACAPTAAASGRAGGGEVGWGVTALPAWLSPENWFKPRLHQLQAAGFWASELFRACFFFEKREKSGAGGLF